jgi:hypothetical protein
MLHEKFLPEYHFSEKHQIEIARPPEKIFKLVNEFDFTESWIIRTLFKLRGMTTGMAVKKGLLQANFIELEVHQNRELLLGLIGQFWKPTGNLKSVRPEEFRAFSQARFLKATWNFLLIPKTENITILETETRIQCLDAYAHRMFSRYWFFIRPFSGIIRREILRSIRKKAERNEVHSSALPEVI